MKHSCLTRIQAFDMSNPSHAPYQTAQNMSTTCHSAPQVPTTTRAAHYSVRCPPKVETRRLPVGESSAQGQALRRCNCSEGLSMPVCREGPLQPRWPAGDARWLRGRSASVSAPDDVPEPEHVTKRACVKNVAVMLCSEGVGCP
jgi:hypothetical protein